MEVALAQLIDQRNVRTNLCEVMRVFINDRNLLLGILISSYILCTYWSYLRMNFLPLGYGAHTAIALWKTDILKKLDRPLITDLGL